MEIVKMRKYTLLLGTILLFITALKIDAVQRFKEVPTYTEVAPGEDALLKCKISDKKGICLWQKDNKPVGMYRGKYEWVTARSTMSADCSLLIRNVKLEIDGGQWQCQVTASNFDMQDALSSPPALLAVRVAPLSPRIIFNGSRVLQDQKIKLSAGSRAVVICEVRHTNPPAHIEWYLESGRLITWTQTNFSEIEKQRVWASRSTLELGVTKSMHGKQLVCRAYHPFYSRPYYQSAYATLDVTFFPVVSVTGSDTNRISNLEEGLSTLSLSCTAEGNPKPHAWWTKDGQNIVSNGPKLIIAPVTRNHSGIYGCQAKSALGQSDPIKIEINVQYAPEIVWIGPKRSINANLYSQVTLECKAVGNPPPSYNWYHCPKINTNKPAKKNRCVGGDVISSTSRLEIFNVSYNQRGRYLCVAKNNIGLMERSHWSETITLNVFGPPAGPAAVVAHGWKGYNANIQIMICADPPPRIAYWERGPLRLDVPSKNDRRKALEKGIIDDCYLYTLTIERVQMPDEGVYTLIVLNDRGFSKHIITFIVHDTVYLASIIAALMMTTVIIFLCPLIFISYFNKKALMNNEIRDFNSAQRRIPEVVAYTHEPHPYCIEMLDIKTEVEPADNSSIELSTLLSADTVLWPSTSV